ncbi:MAG TPA: hypothetical protein VMU18_11985 [Rhodoblastus sp.]|nr:hypothetical protein [Rhodoblastus sp.]
MFDLDVISTALENLNLWRGEDQTATAEDIRNYVDAERRMLQGYAFVDDLLVDGRDPFAYGGSGLLLELNHLVLCGTDPARRKEFAQHIAATESRFYDDHEVGADSFYAWAQEHGHLAALPFAAQIYRRIVGAPQLFIEGNQRTATLVASFVLGRAGRPPLVRSAATFETFATLSAQCKAVDRRRWSHALWGRVMDWRLERFFAASADDRYLAPTSGVPLPPATARRIQPHQA